MKRRPYYIKLLLAHLFLLVVVVALLWAVVANTANAPMPPAIALIVCKTTVVGPPDQNAQFTGAENREWATEDSMLVCRRTEVQVFDLSAAQGAAVQPFNRQRCQRAGIVLGATWNESHKASAYRFLRVACPVPIVNTITGEIIAWKVPHCGKRDIMKCEDDTEA